MKPMQLSTLLALTALSLFGATSHANAADSSMTQSHDGDYAESSTDSQEGFPVILPASVSNQGTRIVVELNALKRLYDTMVASYYDQNGVLLGQDEYGYGTHDIDHLLHVKVAKSYVYPLKLIIVSIKDENGDVVVTKATNL